MSSTFQSVAEIIADTSQIPFEEIKSDSHTINDLEIDSLDFLDIVFAIDKTFGIKIPLETWTKDINEGQSSSDKYFIMSNLCARVDELVAAKSS